MATATLESLPQESIPVFPITDDGRDVDDIEGLTLFAGYPDVEMVGLTTTHMIPDRRAMIARGVLNNLGLPGIPIGAGSVFPLGKEDELLVKYLRDHTIEDKTYEGEGLIECFPDGVQLIGQAIDRYGPDLRVAALAPLTDLAKAAQHDPGTFKRLGSLYIQGQAIVEDGWLKPDPAAYNLKEDMEAAEQVFAFQEDIPMTFVGKYAAYQLSFNRADFAMLEATGNPVGRYMRIHAEKGIASFAARTPAVFERVFGVSVDQLDQIDELSKPYDAIVAKAIARPAGLVAQHIGHHSLIGMSPEQHGIEDPIALKSELMNTMLHALEHIT